jgi:hypothetical protein
MNWGALLTTVLNVFEKNPQLAETLLTTLLNLFASNPPLLAKAVQVGLAHAAAVAPATHVVEVKAA